MEAQSKSQVVKRLATMGQFQKCEIDFGTKAADKARQYVLSKIVHYRKLPLENLAKDGGLSDFMLFAVGCSDQDNVDLIASMYAAQDKMKIEIPKREHLEGKASASLSPLPIINKVTDPRTPLQISGSTNSNETNSNEKNGIPVNTARLIDLDATEGDAKVRVFCCDTTGAMAISCEISGSDVSAGDAYNMIDTIKSPPVIVSRKAKITSKNKAQICIFKGEKKRKSIAKAKSSVGTVKALDDKDTRVKNGMDVAEKLKIKTVTNNNAMNAALLSDREFEKLICKPTKKKQKKEVEWVLENGAEVYSHKQPTVHNAIKQADLPPELDLSNMRARPLAVGAFPGDCVVDKTESGGYVGIGKLCYLLLPAYREFISQFPRELTDAFIVDDDAEAELFESVQEICCCTLNSVELKLTHCDMIPDSNPTNERGGGVYLLTVEPLYSQIGKSKSLKCLYVPTVSSLLLDRFLIDKAEYASSLIKPILEVSCPIRKLIGRKTSSKDGTGEWIEGSIYHINQDYRVNPYNSIHVIWLEQEEGTNKWVYEYNQMNNLVSPWDIELSTYYLMENVTAPTLPRSLMVGKLSALSIILYVNSLDYAEPFKIELNKIPEFYEMFPDSVDPLDLPSLMQRYQEGRYSDGDGIGIALLLNDIHRMIANGLKYNQCNQFFLPYRLCEALQKWSLWLTSQLLKYHGTASLKVYATSVAIRYPLESKFGPVLATTGEIGMSTFSVVSPTPQSLPNHTSPNASGVVNKDNAVVNVIGDEEVHSQFIEM